MFRGCIHVDQVGNLRVRAVRRCIDRDADIQTRKFLFEAFRNGERGIVAILQAENDLDGRGIVLDAE